MITTPRGFITKETAGTLWLHNLYLRTARGLFDAEFADSTLVKISEVDMYLTDVTFEGLNLPVAAGPTTENGLVATDSHVFMSGTAWLPLFHSEPWVQGRRASADLVC